MTSPFKLSTSSTSVEPHATIGAQQMAESKPDKCGFLRKRGRAERALEHLHLSKHINWRQRYVALKDGCCYCYDSETSRSPLRTFSLEGYNRVYRMMADSRVQHIFAVEAAQGLRNKLYCFSASTEEEMKGWMAAFKNAMLQANDAASTASGGSYTSTGEIVYEDLEKPILVEENLGRNGGGNIAKEDPYDDDDDDDDEDEENEEGEYDSDYDQPMEEWLAKDSQPKNARRSAPLPPIPTGGYNGNSNNNNNNKVTSPTVKTLPAGARPAIPIPTQEPKAPPRGPRQPRLPPDPRGRSEPASPPPKPSFTLPARPTPAAKPDPPAKPQPTQAATARTQARQAAAAVAVAAAAAVTGGAKPRGPMRRRLSEQDCLFDKSDRDEAIHILEESSELGTFLIRKSRQGDSKVLVVKTDDGIKEYKIFVEGGQVSLDKRTHFDSVDDLLESYSKNNLPNRSIPLGKPYNS